LLRDSLQRDLAEDFSVVRIEDDEVARRMTPDVDTVIRRIEVDAVGTELGVAVGLSAFGSMVLIICIDFVSNIERSGWLLAKPCPDFGSTTAPLPPPLGISPRGLSVFRSKTVTRPGTASRAGVLSVAGTARTALRVM